MAVGSVEPEQRPNPRPRLVVVMTMVVLGGAIRFGHGQILPRIGRSLSPASADSASRCHTDRVRILRFIALLPLVAVAVGACSFRGSDYQYVRSPGTGTYMKLPDTWDVARIEADESVEFARVFDQTKIDLDGPSWASDRPTGFVQVRSLSSTERDVLSFELARNVVFKVDEGMANGTVTPVKNLKADQGPFRGQRLIFTVEGDGTVATIDQTALVDAKTTRFYLLVIGCTPTCYERHKDEIDAIASSFTLKEP